MREVKYYPPEKRRYFEDNLQCSYCQNTTTFYFNVRLRHKITCLDTGQLSVELDRKITERLSKSFERNIVNLIDKSIYGRQIIKCANCEDGIVDMQERLLDNCWNLGCPGCDVCANYIEESELREYCLECITEKKGCINEDECNYICPHYDDGLEQVRVHYGITLNDLKGELGY